MPDGPGSCWQRDTPGQLALCVVVRPSIDEKCGCSFLITFSPSLHVSNCLAAAWHYLAPYLVDLESIIMSIHVSSILVHWCSQPLRLGDEDGWTWRWYRQAGLLVCFTTLCGQIPTLVSSGSKLMQRVLLSEQVGTSQNPCMRYHEIIYETLWDIGISWVIAGRPPNEKWVRSEKARNLLLKHIDKHSTAQSSR